MENNSINKFTILHKTYVIYALNVAHNTNKYHHIFARRKSGMANDVGDSVKPMTTNRHTLSL